MSARNVETAERGRAAAWRILLALAVLAAIPVPLSAGTSTPHLLPLQGSVTDTAGIPLAAGNLAVRIYDAATGGALVYDSGSDFVGAVSSGRFDVVLGSGTALSLDNTLLYHMEIEVDGDEVIGDANGGRYAFYPGGGSHARDDLEARLTALEDELGVGAPSPRRVPSAPAFSDSSASYRIHYGLLGIGYAQGNSAAYDVKGSLLLQPVGVFTSAVHVLRLGPWFLEAREDSLVVLIHPDSVSLGDTAAVVVEILDAFGTRVEGDSAAIGFQSLRGLTGAAGPARENADTTYSVPFTASGTGLDSLVIWVSPGTSALRDTVTVFIPDRTVITSIRDVGNDQGRQVRVIWNRDSRDVAGATPAITEYVVWRRVDELPSVPRVETVSLDAWGAGSFAPKADREPRTLLLADDVLWEPVGPHVPAMMWKEYASVVPTLADSTIAHGMHWSVFFVSAHTSDPQVYFCSEPDSGYSVDNLAPGAPAGLSMSGAGLLTWEEAPEEDFDYFTVYGSTEEAFGDSAVSLDHTTGTEFDASGSGYEYYFVTATDFSGNEGEAAGIKSTVGVPGDRNPPKARALRPAHPNPFRAASVIAFELPAREEVRLCVYDLSGRVVATLVRGSRDAGIHTVTWSGRDDAGRILPGGVYFYRLEVGSFVRTRRIVFLR